MSLYDIEELILKVLTGYQSMKRSYNSLKGSYKKARRSTRIFELA